MLSLPVVIAWVTGLFSLLPVMALCLHRLILPGLPLLWFSYSNCPRPLFRCRDCFGVEITRPADLQRYNNLNWALVGCLLVLLGICAVGWVFLLADLGDRLVKSSADRDSLVLRPEPSWCLWIVPGNFLGLFTASILVDVLIRLLLKGRFADYQRQEQARVGAPRRREGTYLVLVGIVLAGFSVLSMDWYTRLDSGGITVNTFCGLGETHLPYREVTKVVQTSHLRAGVRPLHQHTQLHVLLEDGRRWSNEDAIGHALCPPDEDRVIAILCQKTGKPLVHARLLEDVLPNE